jgi:hypothetical protein
VKRLPILLLTLAAVMLQSPGARSEGVILEAAGRTWPIEEPDPVAEIKKALNVRKEVIAKELERLQQGALSYKPPGGPVVLEPADKDYEYLVDMTYTLDHDLVVPDGSGKDRILYPAGFTFNVLDYVSLDNTYVIFDGTNPCEARFVKETFGQDPKARLLAANGMTEATEKALGRVAWLLPEIAKVFHLEATVSVVSRQGGNAVIRVHHVDRNCQKSSAANLNASPVEQAWQLAEESNRRVTKENNPEPLNPFRTVTLNPER